MGNAYGGISKPGARIFFMEVLLTSSVFNFSSGTFIIRIKSLYRSVCIMESDPFDTRSSVSIIDSGGNYEFKK